MSDLVLQQNSAISKCCCEWALMSNTMFSLTLMCIFISFAYCQQCFFDIYCITNPLKPFVCVYSIALTKVTQQTPQVKTMKASSFTQCTC